MKSVISFAVQSILIVLVSFSASAQTKSTKWEKEIAAFEAKDKTNAPPKHAIEFIGSSTIRLWNVKRDFPGKQVFNRGFGGSQIDEANAVADRIIFPYGPRLIVFYSGDNDLASGKSPERVFADFEKFVKNIHGHLPDTVIDCISIKPCPSRWKQHEKVQAVNAQIKALAEKDSKLRFIDVYPLMLGEDGKPKRDLFLPDGLHPSIKCYKLWARQLAPALNDQ